VYKTGEKYMGMKVVASPKWQQGGQDELIDAS